MKRPLLFRRVALLCTVLISLGFGCSSGNGLNLAKVRGKVTYKGQPIKNGTVFFMPDEAKGTVGPAAVGTITSDGSYIMSTETAGDGVIVGSHKIGITGLEEKPVSGGEAAPTPESDSKAYMKAKAKDAAATRTAAVKKDADTFTDKGGQRWRFVIPRKFTNPAESGIIAKVQSGSNTMNFEIDDSGNVAVTN
jgi:hypothetical protein